MGGGGIKDLLQIGEGAVLRKHGRILRKAEYYTNSGNILMGIIYRVRLSWIQNKYEMHIPMNCCERGLKIMHVGPILMNKNISVGADCTFHMNTVLAADGVSDDGPRLSDGVVVGVGAIVLGNITIAKNVAIGANAVVTKDVTEENIAVAGIPARKVSNSGRLEWAKTPLNQASKAAAEEILKSKLPHR